MKRLFPCLAAGPGCPLAFPGKSVPGFRIVGLLGAAFLALSQDGAPGSPARAAPEPVDYVRPFVGTDAHGHTFPGATTPLGMVQLSPDTGAKGWDGVSGYHWDASTIVGFSHTHLSGTGIGDFGDILFQPTVGPVRWDEGDPQIPNSGYRSRFSHGTEIAHPGYYKVRLDDSGINVELTATPHAGFHRYVFPNGAQPRVIIDLGHGINNSTKESSLTVEDPSVISGYRHSGGWAKDKTWYFVAEFSRPMAGAALRTDGIIQPDGQKSARGKRVEASLSFSAASGEPLLVKIGLSPTSIDEARKNLTAEIPSWDFDGTAAATRETWNSALSGIQAESKTPADLETFYTALYHSMIAPNLYNNADETYRGADGKIHAGAFNYYQTFSFWDTFRAENPLLTLVQPDHINDFVNTALVFYDQAGTHSLPIWPLAGNETWCMIACHSIPVIVDAYRKGFRAYDAQHAYAAMRDTAASEHEGDGLFQKFGYIPTEQKGNGSVSRTLEIAYDNAAIARLAKALGKDDEASFFAHRAQNYRNVYDAQTGFMRARYADGSWKTPFEPKTCTPDYTEGNAWHYRFFVPQDLPGLIGIMGGDARFILRLDTMFSEESDMPNAPIDVSGRIGQVAQGNEQSHHIAYLYDYAGAPYKTQARVRQIMRELYDNKPDGLCGNDDCGQMSAWFVLNAMGFYSVDPSSGVYAIGSPLLDKATIRLDSRYYPGGAFTIIAENNSDKNVYIQSATFNGKDRKSVV